MLVFFGENIFKDIMRKPLLINTSSPLKWSLSYSETLGKGNIVKHYFCEFYEYCNTNDVFCEISIFLSVKTLFKHWCQLLYKNWL